MSDDRKQDIVRKLERLAERTSSREEADTARKIAERIRKEHGIISSGEIPDEKESPSSRIYVKRYVVRDLSGEDFDDIVDELTRISNQMVREFPYTHEIRWNAEITSRKFFFWRISRRITLWISFLAPDYTLFMRMCSLFLKYTGLRVDKD